MPFLSAVPALRTVPGVDVFDYRIDDDSELTPGDLIRVPFRKKLYPALVVEIKADSAYAEKAIRLENLKPLLRLGKPMIELLERCAETTFTSRPSVLNAWLRQVPRRFKSVEAQVIRRGQLILAERRTAFPLDRFDGKGGIKEITENIRGRRLILVPWQSRAEYFARRLNCPVLHAGLPYGAAWNAVCAFATGNDQILVATRLGAWLSSQADAVLIDEPENDDHKQDEMSPRLDAREIVRLCSDLRPELSVVNISTTPRLADGPMPWTDVPEIIADAKFVPLHGRARSSVEGLTQEALDSVQDAVAQKKHAVILHPVRGERARLTCRDCGWTATCASCGFGLSLADGKALCAKCGRRTQPPTDCGNCGGYDLSRSRAGKDRIGTQVADLSSSGLVRMMDLPGLNSWEPIRGSLLVVTDLSLIGGAVEDIRRKERLAIAWRRLAALAATNDVKLLIQGPEEIMDECVTWLHPDGLKIAYDKELADRRAFSYPPTVRLAKLLVDGEEAVAQSCLTDLRAACPQGMTLRGPFPVAFRADTRSKRWVLHVIWKDKTQTAEMAHILDGFKRRAIIDLDPVSFFS